MFRHKIIYIILILFSFYSTGCGDKINGKIVCFGDSITYGALVEGASWAEVIRNRNKDLEIVNAGRKGRKTSDTTELIPVINRNKDAKHIIFFLGVNDLKNGNDSLVNECIANMKWMIGYTRDKIENVRIYIAAPCGINLDEMSALNKQKKYNINTVRSLLKLEDGYKKLAESENVYFISLLNTVSPDNYVDGLHPNEAGQEEIADEIWNKLLESN